MLSNFSRRLYNSSVHPICFLVGCEQIGDRARTERSILRHRNPEATALVTVRWAAFGAVLTALLLLATSPASAQLYAGGGLGYARAAQPNSALGAGAAINGRDSRDTSWKLLGGYQFSQAWGLETAYTDLGRFGYSVSVPGATTTGATRLRALSVAGTGTLPLSRSWSLMGKLGLSSNRADAGSTSASFGGLTASISGSANRTDVIYGVGVGYNFDQRFGLRFEYENFGATGRFGGGDVKSDNWALSLKYSF